MKSRAVWPILIGISAIIVDQLTKALALSKLQNTPGVFVIKKLYFDFQFQLSINKNLALSIPLQQAVIIILSSLIIIGLIWYLVKNYRSLSQFQHSLLLIITFSATSNLLDRIFRGGVVDFISFRLFNFQYAIFNLADTLIVGAIIIFLIKEILYNKKNI